VLLMFVAVVLVLFFSSAYRYCEVARMFHFDAIRMVCGSVGISSVYM